MPLSTIFQLYHGGQKNVKSSNFAVVTMCLKCSDSNFNLETLVTVFVWFFSVGNYRSSLLGQQWQ
jgi:hypothetical protein